METIRFGIPDYEYSNNLLRMENLEKVIRDAVRVDERRESV